ncbi:MAG: M48 family metalloprotease [Candidatus Eisenbacteria bacterium]|uniref:M48 family metalloprotease n=1 Tax=Eiseniibacteriota bacterium TaxID=2212470 RepID=A0A849SIK7_UNCEI|nr:M48 family metalloprotease [Candidatus Eisenbacteria bacterium]
MQFESYRDLVRRLETEAASDVRRYTLRVAAFGALGYTYLLGMFALLFGVVILGLVLSTHWHVGGIRWICVNLGIATVPMGIVLARVVLARPAVPSGVALTRERAPALFTLLDQVRMATNAPALHHVLLNHDYNCSVLQQPRLGLFGWPRNYLLLGLPMLETLSSDRLRSVIAHEMGHLTADHSTFAGRLFSVSDAWRRLLAHLDAQGGLLLRLFVPFFRWYAPRFGARGFVLGRRAEYFADACARRAAGERSTRGALVRIEVMSRFHHDVMTKLYEQVRERSEPPERGVIEAARRLREDPDAMQAMTWLEDALRAETGYEDTHPALRDRLKHLNPDVPANLGDTLAEPGPSAAQQLLGEAYEALASEIDARWRSEIGTGWKARHDELARTAGELVDLETRGATDGLERDDEWKRVVARIDLQGRAVADDLLTAFIATHPDHAMAQFRRGQLLLDDGDVRGLEHLERAMALDTDAVSAGCDQASAFLRSHGRSDEADAFVQRAWQYGELAEKAQRERQELKKSDSLAPHDLDVDVLVRLRERLANETWLDAVYLVRKQVVHLAGKPCYVLGLVPHRPWHRLSQPTKEAQHAIALLGDGAVPAGVWGFLIVDRLAWAKRRLRRIEGAEIWTRAVAVPPARLTEPLPIAGERADSNPESSATHHAA